MHCKSMDWFPYDKDLRHERVKAQLVLFKMIQSKEMFVESGR